MNAQTRFFKNNPPAIEPATDDDNDMPAVAVEHILRIMEGLARIADHHGVEVAIRIMEALLSRANLVTTPPEHVNIFRPQ